MLRLIKVLSCILALSLSLTPALAKKSKSKKDFFKIGKVRFKIGLDTRITTAVLANTITTGFPGIGRGVSIGSMTIIFPSMAHLIQEGEVFGLTTAFDFEKEKANLNVIATVGNKRRAFAISTDDQSRVRGKVKILSVNKNGSFRAKVKARLLNVRMVKSFGPNRGEEVRGNVRIKSVFTSCNDTCLPLI